MDSLISQAAKIIRNSKYTTAFTGAGISVESGIPPFRGKDGLWSQYNPQILDIDYFVGNPASSWKVIKTIFYDFWDNAEPNNAHLFLAELEKNGRIQSVITQNIDNLHYKAGSKNVREFHGTLKTGMCMDCGYKFEMSSEILKKFPLKCIDCGGIVKPDFVFFGEGIPEDVQWLSLDDIKKAEALIIIGTSGEVMPACQLPFIAKENGAKIIEINTEKSVFTDEITDIFLQGKAGEICDKLLRELLRK